MEFINLKAQYEYIQDDINKRILNVVKSGHFILSDEVDLFEKKIASYVGRKYAVACANGTEALQLIYMAYGISSKDAVFCPDMTFIASIEPAVMLGAHPVFCDIDLQSYNIDPQHLEIKIQEVLEEGKYLPKAIVAVDFLGHPFDVDKISSIAQKYGLILIEDAAQGIGSEIKKKKCGSFGDIAATSFFPTKPLGCYGDGGAIFTDDEEMYRQLKSLRVHGMGKDKYHNIQIGINSRLDAIQAAVLLSKLDILEEELEKRIKIANIYHKELNVYLKTPYIRENCKSNFAQYVVLAPDKIHRTKLLQALHQNDIPTIFYYPTPLHQLPVFQSLKLEDASYQNTIQYSNTAFGIPFSPYLKREEQNKIIKVIQQTMENL